jgi:probable phosphoglycerate mutase
MRLLLVRHGVTLETGRILTGRLPGVSLSADGVAQAEALAERLTATKLTGVYTSPLERCRETANALTRPRRLRPRIDRRFIEIDYGKWSGRRLNDLRQLKAWKHLMETPSRFRFPGGSESLGAAQQRAVAGIETLALRYPEKTIAVVSHNDVIRLVLAYYLGMAADLIHRLHVAPTSVSVVELHSDRGPVVPTVNQIAGVS